MKNAESSSCDEVYTVKMHQTSDFQPIYWAGYKSSSVLQPPATKSTTGTKWPDQKPNEIELREKESSFTYGWLPRWVDLDWRGLQ